MGGIEIDTSTVITAILALLSAISVSLIAKRSQSQKTKSDFIITKEQGAPDLFNSLNSALSRELERQDKKLQARDELVDKLEIKIDQLEEEIQRLRHEIDSKR